MNACAVIVENRFDVADIVARHEKYLPHDWLDTRWINKEPINSIHDYNKLLTSKRFWRLMPEKVLIIQWDSEIWRTGIDDFMDFDMIGAYIPKIPNCYNGGLSLRDTKAMLRVIENFEWYGEQVSGNEDIWFCNCLTQLQGYLPTKEEAQKFSIESELSYGSVGGHAIEKYLTPSECNAVRNQYKT